MELKDFLRTRSKKEFAKILDISVRALANYENGLRLTPLDIAIKIEDISGKRVKPRDLLKTWKDKNG
jgi:predicted transcriptional regulator